jgi:ribose/xylose/arabinose/galactoside ABC-type transport system permease subunit
MPLLTLLVLCAFTALATDRFLSPLNLTNILVQSSIMAVIALGMTFVIIGEASTCRLDRPWRCRGALPRSSW